MTTYRYGREEDEVMGLKFSKEMVIGQDQVVPMINSKMELTPVQEKLLKKLGPNAFPFTFNFPDLAPSSVNFKPFKKKDIIQRENACLKMNFIL